MEYNELNKQTYHTIETLKNDDHNDELNIEGAVKRDNWKKLNNNNIKNNKVKFAGDDIKLNIDNLTYNNLNLDFLNFEKEKYFDKSDNESKYIFFRRVMNAFAIFLENKSLFDKLYTVIQTKNIKEKIISFNFYKYGKLKKSKVQYNQKKYFFEHVYEAYSRFLLRKCYNKNYREDPNFTESDIIQDLTGFYCIENQLSNFLENSDLINKIYDCIYKENNIVFLSNEENGDELYQSYYQILGIFELDNDHYEQINALNSDKSNNFYYNLNNSMTNNNFCLEGIDEFRQFQAYGFGEYRDINSKSNNTMSKNYLNFNNRPKHILIKIRLINQNIFLQNDIRSQVLLDKNRSDLNKLLYQDKDNCNFTWLKIEEIYSFFSTIHIFANKKVEQQISCKFIKMINNDKLVEFKSKWKYSFNTTQKTRDIIIGIHQNQFIYEGFNKNYFIGLVILRCSGGNYTCVDHIYLSENYNNYIQLKLEIGTFMVIPITAGFGPYEIHKNSEKEQKEISEKEFFINSSCNIRKMQFVKVKEKNKKKYLNDCANYLCEEIFSKFDINRDETISLDEAQLLFKYGMKEKLEQAEGNNTEEKIKAFLKDYLDNENLLTLRKFIDFLLDIAIKDGEEVLKEFFIKFGYENIESANSRRAYLSFHSSEKIDIQITDNLLTNFNYISYQMLIKNHGVIAQEEVRGNLRNIEIFELRQYSSRDGRVLSFSVENKFDKPKQFEIYISSQILYTYTSNRISCFLERGESKYLMTLLAKKIINKTDDNKVLIKLGPADKY